MGYRLRISDELYQLLQDRAAKSGETIEVLTEKYIVEAIQLDIENKSRRTTWPWAQSPQAAEPNLRLVNS